MLPTDVFTSKEDILKLLQVLSSNESSEIFPKETSMKSRPQTIDYGRPEIAFFPDQ